MIRTMKLSDYEGVFALWKSTEGMGLRSLDDSRQGAAAFLNRNPAACFAACDEDAIVGAILCGHDGRRGYLYHTVVRSDRRNRRIAAGWRKPPFPPCGRRGSPGPV